MELHRELGDRAGVADALDGLGYGHHHLGLHAQARAEYREAIALWRDLSDQHDEAVTRIRLGDAQEADGSLSSKDRLLLVVVSLRSCPPIRSERQEVAHG